MAEDIVEALELVGQYLTLPRYTVTSDPDVEWDTFPVVAKIASMEHKSERGGVILNIKDRKELKEAIEQLLQLSDKVIVQEQVKGVEVFLGGREDPSFGPVISLGLGGVFVEVYKDVSTRLVPVTGADVMDMINELKGAAILKGYRGVRVNFDALVRSVVSFSRFIERYRPRVVEVNPLIVNERDAYAVDVRLFLD